MTAEALQLDGRHTIGPDTEILGGIYYRHVALVVDFAENPEKYEDVYARLDAELSPDDQDSLLMLGYTVNSVAQNAIKFEPLINGMILKAQAQALGLERVDERHAIGLSTFLETGAGVCHHQALLAGSLIRLLQDRRGLGGHVSLEVPEQVNAAGLKHPWLRYVRDDGKLIVDVNQNRVLAFRESLPAGLDEYLRPEEIAARADLKLRNRQ